MADKHAVVEKLNPTPKQLPIEHQALPILKAMGLRNAAMFSTSSGSDRTTCAAWTPDRRIATCASLAQSFAHPSAVTNTSA
jgi:hypothetical protein